MYLKKAVILASIANVANNGSGLFRVTTSSAHGRATNDVVYIHDVLGAPNANGRWVITAIDANTFDLQGSTFAGTYTSGGYACTKQELRLAATSSPSTPLEVTLAIQYRNPLTGAYVTVDTIIDSLPSSTPVTVLVSDLTYDTIVDSCNVFNVDGSTRIIEVTQANSKKVSKTARASLATLERANVTRARMDAYSSTGRLLQEIP
jgi:hypothetical protein